MKTVIRTCFTVTLLTSITINAQTAPPPTFGETTKGTPAVLETPDAIDPQQNKDAKPNPASDDDQVPTSFADNLLGKAKIKESRRDSGQVYLIELEHSSGSKQYIEEHDSDGQLSPDDNNLDSTPNLAKWKLGSW